MTLRFTTTAALLLLLAPLPLRAQDPTEEIKEIARKIQEQMQEIDRLLLESSKPVGGTQPLPKEQLQRTQEQSRAVEQSIDELIEKLQGMKNQSSGSPDPNNRDPQQQQQQQQQQQGDPQQSGEQQGQPQGQQNRREGATPDYMNQEQQQGQQQGQNRQGDPQQQQQQEGQPQQGQPQGGQENPDGGQNLPGQKPPDGAAARAQPGKGDGEWGDLQPYLNTLKNRGSPPKVPEKFRRYFEAYLKAKKDK